jgi:hypothetical protein
VTAELLKALSEERDVAIAWHLARVRSWAEDPCEETAMVMLASMLVVHGYDAALAGDMGMANFLIERAEILASRVAARRLRQVEAAEAAWLN